MTVSSVRWRVAALPVAVSVLVGVAFGLVWSVLAPPERVVVVSPGVGAGLTGESLHRFDSLALFVCGAFIAGIVVPVGFWAWTRARGPLLYIGLLIGAVLGSAAMLGVGVLVAGLLNPRPDDPAVGEVVTVAPGLESPLVVVVQALVCSLVVVLLAAMNPHDNLQYTVEDEQQDAEDQDSDVENVSASGDPTLHGGRS